MYHEKWYHNALVEGIFVEFADEIDAMIKEHVCEIAKKLIKFGDSDEKIAAATGLSLEDVVVFRSQLEA
jgi:hypothetical protein